MAAICLGLNVLKGVIEVKLLMEYRKIIILLFVIQPEKKDRQTIEYPLNDCHDTLCDNEFSNSKIPRNNFTTSHNP